MQKTIQTEQAVDKNQYLIDSLEKARKKGSLVSEVPFEWLNENSRNFLAAGYLTEGVTAEERIYEIALRAEEILQMPGYADKFYYYMSEGFYSLIFN